MEKFQKPKLRGTKKLFLKLGTCSRTLGFILNRHFGNNSEVHEKALDPLAGGIIQAGYQCGMLWGASLALGTESYRRNKDIDVAAATTIAATRHVMDSFRKRTGHIDCFDITDTDFSSKASMAKYMITGKFFSCFKLAEKWAPEAIVAAEEGLDLIKEKPAEKCLSCATEVARKMGASEEEAQMVAGFAGGIGLSGQACGALGAAIWMKSIVRGTKEKAPSYSSNPEAEKMLEEFYQETDFEILCQNITGKKFNNVQEHTSFIASGGCKKLIDLLANSN